MLALSNTLCIIVFGGTEIYDDAVSLDIHCGRRPPLESCVKKFAEAILDVASRGEVTAGYNCK